MRERPQSVYVICGMDFGEMFASSDCFVQDVKNLKPATDFYKSFALSCSGYQIAVDLFAINSQYIDMATLSTN